jgi:imidazole glycerol phosphate synthase glutamine amidotransferase subunit
MTRKTIGIVDYGVGNHASVIQAFQSLNYRCRVGVEPNVLAECDVLVLPGVGAYPAAMSALHARSLVEFLREQASSGKPLIGLCLGMQLLADESLEYGATAGLGLIPGTVRPLGGIGWHIGWNSMETDQSDRLMAPSDGESFYFNHSFVFDVPAAYQRAITRVQGSSFTVAVRRSNVVGLQFHPEKSQAAGKKLLSRLVEGLCNA